MLEKSFSILIFQLYGGQVSGLILSCLARLFTLFLQFRGFTLGVEAILCTPKVGGQRVFRYCQPDAVKNGPRRSLSIFTYLRK